jgi:hypothetical protein
MGIQGEKSIREKITGIILTKLQFSWFEVIGVLWGAGKKIKQGLAARGVLSIVSTISTPWYSICTETAPDTKKEV